MSGTGDAVVKGINAGISQSPLPRTSTNQTQKVASSQVSDVSKETKQNKLLKAIRTHNNTINYVVNGGASVLNLITFLNGNFSFAESLQESLDTISRYYTKLATGSQGFLMALENHRRENLLPFIGNILEIPVAVFSSSYNLWLSRGIAQGISQFQRIFEKRPMRDNEGKPIPDKFLTRDFSKSGNNLRWLVGLKTSLLEMPKILRELFNDPKKKLHDSTHPMFFFSLWQICGALISFTGLHKLGSGIRNIGGAAVDISLMLDKSIKTQLDSKTNNDEKSTTDYAISGSIWIGSEIVDFFKRFNFFSDKAAYLTNLSLFFDRLAATFMTKGNLDPNN